MEEIMEMWWRCEEDNEGDLEYNIVEITEEIME